MVLLMEPPASVRDVSARQALAEAVAAHRAAQADHTATRAAVEAAEQAVLDARELHDAAEAAVAAAPQEAADHHQALARGTAGLAPASSRERRDALLDAEDALTAARSARDILRQRVPHDADRVSWAEQRCRGAALNVLRSECAGTGAELLAELERVQQDAARLGRVAEWMTGAGVVEAAGAARAAVARHQSAPSGWFREPGAPDPARGWQAVLAGLEADANAPSIPEQYDIGPGSLRCRRRRPREKNPVRYATKGSAAIGLRPAAKVQGSARCAFKTSQKPPIRSPGASCKAGLMRSGAYPQPGAKLTSTATRPSSLTG